MAVPSQLQGPKLWPGKTRWVCLSADRERTACPVTQRGASPLRVAVDRVLLACRGLLVTWGLSSAAGLGMWSAHHLRVVLNWIWARGPRSDLGLGRQSLCSSRGPMQQLVVNVAAISTTRKVD